MGFLFDAPIKSKEQDLLHRTEFAKRFAENLVALSQSECFTVALNGCWGSGKTSLINLIKNHLDYLINYDDSIDFYPVIIDFSPWNVLEENAIIKQFFDCFTANFPVTKLKNFLKITKQN